VLTPTQKEAIIMSMNTTSPKPYSNPYISGIFLGLTLLASFLILGAGLGASSGLARIGASIEGFVFPAHTAASEYFGKWGTSPMNYYLVHMLVGAFLGGLFSALYHARISIQVEKGKKSTVKQRLIMAGVGGVLVGFSSRLAAGCTSGQALTGGALLLTGSLVFLCCVFAGGYAAAYWVRRQWDD